MNTKNERETTIDILIEILEGEAFNNLALRRTLDNSAHLTLHQKAFVTEVVNGVLRNLGLIDHIIGSVSSVKIKKMRPFVRNSLRSAVYQLLFMKSSADFAVCSETVDLIKKRGMTSLSGFVNGVLRNIIRNKDSISFPDESKSPVEFLSVKYSVPNWLVEMWIDDFGYEKAKRMCEINNTPPSVTLCVNTLLTTTENLTKKLIACGTEVKKLENFPNALKVSKLSGIAEMPEFVKGEFHVMDESAMFAVKALDPKPGENVLDICAAPGGKSFFSAYKMKNNGKIVSNDIFNHKAALIKSGAKRLKIEIIEATTIDAAKECAEFINKFDKVLVDAPCTGFGVVRKKPDIKLTKTENSQKEMSELQRKILEQAAKYVKSGGKLVYSTCTLTKDENENNAAWFKDNFDFELVSEQTILPQDYDSDGFYVARFIRIEK